jgi:hypothetical protein
MMVEEEPVSTSNALEDLEKYSAVRKSTPCIFDLLHMHLDIKLGQVFVIQKHYNLNPDGQYSIPRHSSDTLPGHKPGQHQKLLQKQVRTTWNMPFPILLFFGIHQAKDWTPWRLSASCHIENRFSCCRISDHHRH